MPGQPIRAVCQTCYRTVHIRQDARGRDVYASHNNKSKRPCPASGEPVTVK